MDGKKDAQKPKHSIITRLVRRLLADIILVGWYVDSQEPITTGDSEPEPDVLILKGTEKDYLDRHPQPSDVALVVEVSDATLSRDQGIKKRLYAAAAIPVYWIINLPDDQLVSSDAAIYEQGRPRPASNQQATFCSYQASPLTHVPATSKSQ
ncbi:MAG: Uma2 family endonuclease [Anaerolineae bacterium]|nr:Uma2 family endonuclease [Anaerolineae bacterium]